MAQSLKDWIGQNGNRALLHKLTNAGVKLVLPASSNAAQVFAGKTFVITGTLPELGRDEAKQMIKDRGGKVRASVSRKTDYLLLGADAGSKYDEAKALGIAMIDETAFHKLLGSSTRGQGPRT